MLEENAPLQERGLTQESVFRGEIFKVRVDAVALPDGSVTQREIVEHPGAIAVLPLTADGKVVLVRQFRYAIGGVTLEIPAGKLDRPGEPPLAAAQRELAEETGYRAESWRYLGLLHPTPGFATEKLHLFLATGLVSGPPSLEADEFIDVVELPVAEAVEAVFKGAITDAKTMTALLWRERFGDATGQTLPLPGVLDADA